MMSIFSLLNIRSLKKHSIDLKFDSRLSNSDIIALTETQLLSQDCDTEITNNLFPFKLQRQDHDFHKYSSMALCSKNAVEISDCVYYPTINGQKFNLNKCQSEEKKSFYGDFSGK